MRSKSVLASALILAACNSQDADRENQQSSTTPTAEIQPSAQLWPLAGQANVTPAPPITFPKIEYSGADGTVHTDPYSYREPFDELTARDNAESELQMETYRSIGSPYGCTEDCQGHEAGFKYRARHGFGSSIGEESNSHSFRQGQQAFDDEVERRVDEARREHELNEGF